MSETLKVLFNSNNMIGLEYLDDIKSLTQNNDEYQTISMPFKSMNTRVLFYIDLNEIDETKTDIESDEFLNDLSQLYITYFMLLRQSNSKTL